MAKISLNTYEVTLKREITFVIDANSKEEAIKEASILLDESPQDLFDLDLWDIIVKKKPAKTP